MRVGLRHTVSIDCIQVSETHESNQQSPLGKAPELVFCYNVYIQGRMYRDSSMNSPG